MTGKVVGRGIGVLRGESNAFLRVTSGESPCSVVISCSRRGQPWEKRHREDLSCLRTEVAQKPSQKKTTHLCLH